MEQEQGIHYRTGGKLTHCGCECLPGGRDIQYIIIERIEYKETEEIAGRRESNIWVAHFAPNPYTKLPMVLNATNRKRLAKLYPDCNGYINLLKNIPVRLTKEKCRDAQDGGDTWGLRISKMRPTVPQQGATEIRRQYQHGSASGPAPVQQAQPQAAPTPAQEKQTLELTDEAMVSQAITYLKNGGNIESIKNKYNLSAETEKELLKRAQEA